MISLNSTQPEDIRGTIHLTLSYDLAAEILNVRLIEVMCCMNAQKIESF